jgi:predicted DCC family thiol-disulfide oxidoreductase YuxK
VRNGWTGGQYSIVRGVFGLWLLAGFVWTLPWALELSSSGAGWVVAGLLALAGSSLLLAIGAWTRVTALLLFCSIVASPALATPRPTEPSLGLIYVAWLLVVNAVVPPAPYGSWTARGADDPGSGWRMPDVLFTATWIVLLAGFAYVVWRAAGTALAVALVPLALVRPLRPWAWLAVSGVHVVLAGPSTAALMLQAFAFDPGWIPGRATAGRSTIFYDGACGLCHRAVRFVLAEDRDGLAFRFAPLDSETFRADVPEALRPGLPDSIVLRDPDGALHVKSNAVLAIGARLGGLWRVLATIVGIVPSSLRDAAYDVVARVRRRVFTQPKTACPLLPPHLRERLLAGGSRAALRLRSVSRCRRSA